MTSSLKARFISMVLKLYLFIFGNNLYYILFRELFKHDVLKTEGAESQDQVRTWFHVCRISRHPQSLYLCTLISALMCRQNLCKHCKLI